MKGKIRVYARWRPLSEKEIRENERVSLQSPDEFTIEHPWKDEKKQHQFDHVFDDAGTQETIFEDTKVIWVHAHVQIWSCNYLSEPKGCLSLMRLAHVIPIVKEGAL
jgi:hypothetical protein